MKNYKLIFSLFLLFIVYNRNAYSQTIWENVSDTIKITEGEIADSVIITILDSALSFLRLPPENVDLPVYYVLRVMKGDNSFVDGFYNIKLNVDNELGYAINDPEWFHYQKNTVEL